MVNKQIMLIEPNTKVNWNYSIKTGKEKKTNILN